MVFRNKTCFLPPGSAEPEIVVFTYRQVFIEITVLLENFTADHNG